MHKDGIWEVSVSRYELHLVYPYRTHHNTGLPKDGVVPNGHLKGRRHSHDLGYALQTSLLQYSRLVKGSINSLRFHPNKELANNLAWAPMTENPKNHM